MALTSEQKERVNNMCPSAKKASLGDALQAIQSVSPSEMTALSGSGYIYRAGTAGAVEEYDASGDGKILVGDGTDIASVSVSGDVTLSNTGAVTIATGAVEDSMIEALADGEFIIGTDGTAANNAKVTMSGDASLANDGTLTLATTTKVCGIALTSLKCEDAGKDDLPDSPDGDGGTLGLADAIGSPVVGTTTNNTSATEKCAFDFVVPADYVAGNDIVCRINALVSASRNAESLLDVVVKHIKAGELDATDLCLTDGIDMAAVTTAANQDFTIDSDASGDELAAGDVLHVEISFETDDTGGSTDGYGQINSIAMRVPCKA